MNETVVDLVPECDPQAATTQRQEIAAKFFHGLSDVTRMQIVELCSTRVRRMSQSL